MTPSPEASAQARELWLREENLPALLGLLPVVAGVEVVDADAVLSEVLHSDPSRGRWHRVALAGDAPVVLRAGLERGTGVVELQVTPTDWGADAVVERLRTLCLVMQSWTLERLAR